MGGIYSTGGNNGQLYLGNSAGTETIILDSAGTSFFNGGKVIIATTCAAFGRNLTVQGDIVAYYSDTENITMGITAGTGAQSWGIQVCDTGDGTNTLHLNARGGYVGINKGAGNSAQASLDVSGAILASGPISGNPIIFCSNYSYNEVVYSGYAAGTDAFGVRFCFTNQQSNFELTAIINHYGLAQGYGAIRKTLGAVGPNYQSVDLVNSTSGNGGCWLIYSEVSGLIVCKSAGTYGGAGYWFVKVGGNYVCKTSV